MSRKQKRKKPLQPLFEGAVCEDNPAVLAILQECEDRLKLALDAQKLGAYPGPAWVEGTRHLLGILQRVQKERRR